MSAKWRRVQAWDARVFPKWAWPIKAGLHALSSISLAVVLLVGVCIYAVLASVPIGILALAPTWAIYGLTLVVAIALLGVLPAWLIGALIPKSKPGARFAARLLLGLGLSVASAWVWGQTAWPALHYDPSTGDGLRLFASFVHDNRATTMRRLPGIELSELEFYSAWPMQAILGLFVLNMVVATLRRIEFTFKNLGVLTVHTGIVVIALGSIYYQTQKLEGDTLLIAGQPDRSGVSGPGLAQRAFFDNVRVALWLDQLGGVGWEQRRLDDIPRYNEYGLGAGQDRRTAPPAFDPEFAKGLERSLSIEAPPARSPENSSIDPRLNFRIVGYAPYAQPAEDWVRASPGPEPTPMRTVDLYFDDPNTELPSTEPAMTFSLTPTRPATRASDTGVLAVEYSIGMSDERFNELATELPHAVAHGLVVRIPALDHEQVVAPQPGQRVELADTGWAIELEQLHPRPPFPIITKGYEGATSPVATVRVFPPDESPYTRWVYSRYPEINQDLLDDPPPGEPARRNADPAIELVSIDAARLTIHIDEHPDTGAVRAIIREPGGEPRIINNLQPGARITDVIDRIDIALGDRWANARRANFPDPVPSADRDSNLVGTHDRAMLAVEVTMEGHPDWREIVWLQFVKYLSVSVQDRARTITPPEGRPISLAFGRLQWPFPGFQIRMLDFEMIAYDHRGAPRDYQTLVGVEPSSQDSAFKGYRHITRLNAPLKAPFLWSDERSLPANIVGEIASHLRPDQFKLSQAGWDSDGWRESQSLVDQGVLPRPRARYTILQVGNNPGIHVIAFGGVLMSVGIPWAFYVKPWLVRREKDAIKRQLRHSIADKDPEPDHTEQAAHETTPAQTARHPTQQVNA